MQLTLKRNRTTAGASTSQAGASTSQAGASTSQAANLIRALLVDDCALPTFTRPINLNANNVEITEQGKAMFLATANHQKHVSFKLEEPQVPSFAKHVHAFNSIEPFFSGTNKLAENNPAYLLNLAMVTFSLVFALGQNRLAVLQDINKVKTQANQPVLALDVDNTQSATFALIECCLTNAQAIKTFLIDTLQKISALNIRTSASVAEIAFAEQIIQELKKIDPAQNPTPLLNMKQIWLLLLNNPIKQFMQNVNGIHALTVSNDDKQKFFNNHCMITAFNFVLSYQKLLGFLAAPIPTEFTKDFYLKIMRFFWETNANFNQPNYQYQQHICFTNLNKMEICINAIMLGQPVTNQALDYLNKMIEFINPENHALYFTEHFINAPLFLSKLQVWLKQNSSKLDNLRKIYHQTHVKQPVFIIDSNSIFSIQNNKMIPKSYAQSLIKRLHSSNIRMFFLVDNTTNKNAVETFIKNFYKNTTLQNAALATNTFLIKNNLVNPIQTVYQSKAYTVVGRICNKLDDLKMMQTAWIPNCDLNANSLNYGQLSSPTALTPFFGLLSALT